MESSPDRVDNAANLAHELLGHAYRKIQAQKAGVLPAFYKYVNDETNARLAGWVVKAELDGKLDSHLPAGR